MGSGLKYGPVGNPNSPDPYEWAQARMPQGWHVEGQIVGGRMMATTRDGLKVYATDARGLVEAVAKASTKRPYAGLSGRELDNELGRQLTSPSDIVDATVFGDHNKTYLAGPLYQRGNAVALSNGATTGNVIYSTNTIESPATGQRWVLEDSYVMTPDGKVKPVSQTKVKEAKLESDRQWLKRRVAEICWNPALP